MVDRRLLDVRLSKVLRQVVGLVGHPPNRRLLYRLLKKRLNQFHPPPLQPNPIPTMNVFLSWRCFFVTCFVTTGLI